MGHGIQIGIQTLIQKRYAAVRSRREQHQLKNEQHPIPHPVVRCSIACNLLENPSAVWTVVVHWHFTLSAFLMRTRSVGPLGKEGFEFEQGEFEGLEPPRVKLQGLRRLGECDEAVAAYPGELGRGFFGSSEH